jgi:hypothetical protein
LSFFGSTANTVPFPKIICVSEVAFKFARLVSTVSESQVVAFNCVPLVSSIVVALMRVPFVKLRRIPFAKIRGNCVESNWNLPLMIALPLRVVTLAGSVEFTGIE